MSSSNAFTAAERVRLPLTYDSSSILLAFQNELTIFSGRTHTAEVDRDVVTGNKLINQYEILEELGRGEHGKVKLGRHVVTRQQVAIKIVQRYSKRRRLGKLGNPEDKVKKEVAILKKARHPNVVSLLEVIDDPNSQKVYIVLEYVENGEIIWRKKGLREIVHVDKIRIEREKSGLSDTPAFVEESLQYVRTAQHLRRQREKARERRQAHAATVQQFHIPAWSLEHGGESDDEQGPEISIPNKPTSHAFRNGQDDTQHSPRQSLASSSFDSNEYRNDDSALAAVEGSMYGAYIDPPFERRFSTASSSFGYAPSEPEWQSDDDDMSYVPCLTMSEARSAFRDAVLGLEYLHYQGIIHRDIKPANLLMTSNHRVKISDFGVSYLGRPIRDDDDEQDLTERDASELDDARELSKTVGTPAFYAPELCYTGDDFVDSIGAVPKITGAIDVWSLGVTLYGMIFGRLPFLSDDEYSMFQNIVKKDVYIPRKRLKPIERNDQQARGANSDTRPEDVLDYEEVDDELFDLLKRILTKDPVKRITIKEIKHHPWVLRGLPNPRAWVEETDPAYQSKGKRIEVSKEEVTTAVSKVPFIERVRSNVAKWSTYLTGRTKDKIKDRDIRKRTHSASPSADLRRSSTKSLWEGRRFSLKGDEEMTWRPKAPKEGEHPLAQSVTASPVEQEEKSSYFDSDGYNGSRRQTPQTDPSIRPTSTLSTAESTKTVRPPDSEVPLSIHLPTGPVSPGLGSLFGGAGNRPARGLQTGQPYAERPPSDETTSLRENRHSGPSLALSMTPAVGQVENAALWREGEYPPMQAARSARPEYRRSRSDQPSCESSAESFYLTKDALLRQRQHDLDSNTDGGNVSSRVEGDMYSNGMTNSRRVTPKAVDCSPAGTRSDSPGLTTSPPSAATISSSSIDDYASGLSQSASHPSVPSKASSLSGDLCHASESKDRENYHDPSVRIATNIQMCETSRAQEFCPDRQEKDDELRYFDDDEDESEDEGIIMFRKRPSHREQKLNA